jgi:hypothetical protein
MPVNFNENGLKINLKSRQVNNIRQVMGKDRGNGRVAL